MTQPELEQMVLVLKGRIDELEKTDRYTFAKLLQFLDGRNVQLGTTTGTKIGTASNQKLGFFGATPVVQQAGISSPSGGGTIDAASRTSIISIINVLHTFGLIS